MIERHTIMLRNPYLDGTHKSINAQFPAYFLPYRLLKYNFKDLVVPRILIKDY
jgi:hypothetical protein